MTAKELNVLVAKVGAAVLGMCLDMTFLTVNLFGLTVTVLVVFGAMFAFTWIFDLINEDKDSLKTVRKFSNFFPVFYVLLVVEFFVMKYFRFL